MAVDLARARPKALRSRGLATWLAFVWLLIAVSPIWLGPLLTPLRLAIADAHHTCACGMTPGTCGCPECDRLERERLSDKEPEACPVLKGECERDAAFLGGSHVPPAVMPPLPRIEPARTLAQLATPLPRAALLSVALPAPPKPPPRLA
jgi:hypothetical protein